MKTADSKEKFEAPDTLSRDDLLNIYVIPTELDWTIKAYDQESKLENELERPIHILMKLAGSGKDEYKGLVCTNIPSNLKGALTNAYSSNNTPIKSAAFRGESKKTEKTVFKPSNLFVKGEPVFRKVEISSISYNEVGEPDNVSVRYRPRDEAKIGPKVNFRSSSMLVSHKDTAQSIERKLTALLNPNVRGVLDRFEPKTVCTVGNKDYEAFDAFYKLYDTETGKVIQAMVADNFVDTSIHITFSRQKKTKSDKY